MARQAEAEREKRAKIINAEGESLAATALGDASDTMMATPGAAAAEPAEPGRDRRGQLTEGVEELRQAGAEGEHVRGQPGVRGLPQCSGQRRMVPDLPGLQRGKHAAQDPAVGVEAQC